MLKNLQVSVDPVVVIFFAKKFYVVQIKFRFNCRNPHCSNGVVDTFGPSHFLSPNGQGLQVDRARNANIEKC